MRFGLSDEVLLVAQGALRAYFDEELDYGSESAVAVGLAVEFFEEVHNDPIPAQKEKVLLIFGFLLAFDVFLGRLGLLLRVLADIHLAFVEFAHF